MSGTTPPASFDDADVSTPHSGDLRSISPRRSAQEIAELGRQAHNEIQEEAKVLKESVLSISGQIQAIGHELDKLGTSNRHLQKRIGDLAATSAAEKNARAAAAAAAAAGSGSGSGSGQKQPTRG